jgi:hypothetical protein
MNQKIGWFNWLAVMFKEFMCENETKSQFEIVDLFECKKTSLTKAVIKLAERHSIEKKISDIIIDDQFIEGLDKKSIRTLTFIATVEMLKPDYSITVQQMTNEVDEYLLEIKSRNNQTTLRKSPSEISKDKQILAKFDPVEANRIGYLAGVRETVKEFQMLNKDQESL